MLITRTALAHIKHLRDHKGGDRTVGLRLRMRGRSVDLKWSSAAPGGGDLILARQGVRIFIDALTYASLADCALDFITRGGSSRFMLRPKPKHRATRGTHAR